MFLDSRKILILQDYLATLKCCSFHVKDEKRNVHFSMLTWNEQLPVLKLVCIENLLLLDSTYVGNLSVPLNKKQTLYQLWYTGH